MVEDTSELISCWPPLRLHQVRHFGVSCPKLISFSCLEIWTAEFGSYLDLFGKMGPVSVLLEKLLHTSQHSSDEQLEMRVTPYAQCAAGEQDLQRLDAMEEHQA